MAVGFNNADFGRFNLWRPLGVNRTRGSNRLSALPTGSAGMSFPGKPGKPEKLGTPIYGSQFRVLFGGSNRVQALPA